jgi:hypothetical protein
MLYFTKDIGECQEEAASKPKQTCKQLGLLHYATAPDFQVLSK